MRRTKAACALHTEGSPRLTVVMPVLNGDPFIEDAIRSVLAQTFTDFELLVISDGSTDQTVALVKRFDDARVRLVEHGDTKGIASRLNEGLDTAQGEYIARMDADDLSEPRRFELQVRFLDSHVDVDCCGARIRTINSNGEQRLWALPIRASEIRALLPFVNCIAHPTVMMRASSFKRLGLRYSETAPHVEDYELWLRSSAHLTFANLSRPLLKYRLTEDGISRQYRTEQAVSRSAVQVANWRANGLWLDGLDHALSEGNAASLDDLRRTQAALNALVRSNAMRRVYDVRTFNRVVTEVRYAACAAATRLGAHRWFTYLEGGFALGVWVAILAQGRRVLRKLGYEFASPV